MVRRGVSRSVGARDGALREEREREREGEVVFTCCEKFALVCWILFEHCELIVSYSFKNEPECP